MNALIKRLVKTNPAVLRRSAILNQSVRNHWNYQYKPGPYPRTPQERAAAARKYGLTPEEYKPFPEDMNFGDYPQLPDISPESKDVYYPYDLPSMKRNFNEPLHVQTEFIGEDRYNISYVHRIPLWEQWLWFICVVGGFYLIYDSLEGCKTGKPVVAKQYPFTGEVHYTFDGN